MSVNLPWFSAIETFKLLSLTCKSLGTIVPFYFCSQIFTHSLTMTKFLFPQEFFHIIFSIFWFYYSLSHKYLSYSSLSLSAQLKFHSGPKAFPKFPSESDLFYVSSQFLFLFPFQYISFTYLTVEGFTHSEMYKS